MYFLSLLLKNGKKKLLGAEINFSSHMFAYLILKLFTGGLIPIQNSSLSRSIAFDVEVLKDFLSFNIHLFSYIPLVTKEFKYFTGHVLEILGYMTQITYYFSNFSMSLCRLCRTYTMTTEAISNYVFS